MKPSKKIVKGYALVWKYTGEIHAPTKAPEVRDRTYMVFPKKKDACANIGMSKALMKVIPCTITYSLPKKPKC